MRTFIAVRIPSVHSIDSVLRHLSMLQPALRTIAPDQLHVTLAFLGETDESLLPELTQILQDVAATETVHELAVRGLGVFPRITHPTVVWAGFANPGPLVRMADQLARRCEALGFAREARPFQPHLTLARVKAKPPEELAGYIQARVDADFGSVTISSLELSRSDLEPAGPVYTSLVCAPLTP